MPSVFLLQIARSKQGPKIQANGMEYFHENGNIKYIYLSSSQSLAFWRTEPLRPGSSAWDAPVTRLIRSATPSTLRDPLRVSAQKRPRPLPHAGGLRQDRAGDSLLLRGRAPAASAVPAPSPRALASTHRSLLSTLSVL
jgi:hypothetical protein